MPEENGGKKNTGLLEQIRQEVKALPQILKAKGKEELEGLKEPQKTQLFRSIFPVKHEDTPRSRALDGHCRLAAYVPRLPDRRLQAAARIQLVRRRDLDGAHPALVVHRLSAAG